MNTRLTGRRARASLTAGAAVLCALMTSSVAGSQNAMLFTGGGYGPTVESAIQGAIEDAEASAQSVGLYTCQLVGEPKIFPGPNPKWHRNFTAEATVACTN